MDGDRLEDLVPGSLKYDMLRMRMEIEEKKQKEQEEYEKQRKVRIFQEAVEISSHEEELAEKEEKDSKDEEIVEEEKSEQDEQIQPNVIESKVEETVEILHIDIDETNSETEKVLMEIKNNVPEELSTVQEENEEDEEMDDLENDDILEVSDAESLNLDDEMVIDTKEYHADLTDQSRHGTHGEDDGINLSKIKQQTKLKDKKKGIKHESDLQLVQSTIIEEKFNEDEDEYVRRIQEQDKELVSSSDEQDEMKDIDLIENDEQLEENKQRVRRETLFRKYVQAANNREKLMTQNDKLQHDIYELLRNKKKGLSINGSETSEQPTSSADRQEQEHRYLRYMTEIEKLKEESANHENVLNSGIIELKLESEKASEEAMTLWKEIMKFLRSSLENAQNSRTGEIIKPIEINERLRRFEMKNDEVKEVRLSWIKLKNALEKHEVVMQQKDRLNEANLNMMDFEQLKVENQTYNEKIEDRNEDIINLQKKISQNIHILTHIKEKLKFIEENCESRTGRLNELDGELSKKRDTVGHLKQSRDTLRMQNVMLQKNSGLYMMQSKQLLQDYAYHRDDNEKLDKKIEELKTKHNRLTIFKKQAISATNIRKTHEEIDQKNKICTTPFTQQITTFSEN
ncbi:hypothetical protein SNEBB_003114 [Seison nebaliae]|nr:hypothetical protein SNEBB_003114 [Seison nebaliae]